MKAEKGLIEFDMSPQSLFMTQPHCFTIKERRYVLQKSRRFHLCRK